ncbi:MAG: hypothetical protein JWN70_4609 [Planctomycetaceae bacterium]|nr:hypothetical protein [Planctomycetaceae bacterium]
MSDSEQSPSDQLDQLFAAPGAAPVPPAPATPPIVLPDPQTGAPVPPAQQAAKQRIVRFQDLLEKLTPVVWVTPTLLVVNVAYFIVMVSQGVDFLQPEVPQLLEWGANYAPLTWNGQPWRLLSSFFIHFGILHLAVNMWSLWSVGRMLERMVGNIGYLIIYFASGIAGSVASLWWNGDVVSAGASGAIFGLLGAFATFIWNRADSFPPAALSQLRSSLAKCIGINLLFGAAIQGIDQAAHIGGLVCGLACGWLLSQPLDQFNVQRRFKKNLVTAAIALLTLGTMILQHPPPPPDLFMELAIYDQLVPQTINKFNEAAGKFNERKMTSQQMVELVRKEILPPWIQVREHIDKLANIPSGRRELIHQVRSQLLTREEAWKLMIDGLEHDDKQKFDEYKVKWKQAEHLREQLEPK